MNHPIKVQYCGLPEICKPIDLVEDWKVFLDRTWQVRNVPKSLDFDDDESSFIIPKTFRPVIKKIFLSASNSYRHGVEITFRKEDSPEHHIFEGWNSWDIKPESLNTLIYKVCDL